MHDFFEKFWLKKAADALGVPSDAEDVGNGDLTENAKTVLEKIRPSVAALSDLFTVERPRDGKFRDYMSEPKLLAAYGLFFFPQSFARAEFALRRTLDFYARGNAACGSAETPIRILDLGSGAAPCGLAAVQVLRERFPQREIALTALDRSRSALEAARALTQIFPEKIAFAALPADLKKGVPAKLALPPQDLILLGWSLNECVPAPADAVPFLRALAPLLALNGVLLVLEPALKITAERLQRASDFFAQKSNRGAPFFRLAPELGEHACPLLREGIFWNHEVRAWTPPPCTEFLNRKLFREIGALKFAWCALGKTPPRRFDVPAGACGLLRLVSPIETTKHCLRFVGVNPRGEKICVEMPTRGLSKSDVKKLAASRERGDIVALAGTLEPLGAGTFRFTGTLRDFS